MSTDEIHIDKEDLEIFDCAYTFAEHIVELYKEEGFEANSFEDAIFNARFTAYGVIGTSIHDAEYPPDTTLFMMMRVVETAACLSLKMYPPTEELVDGKTFLDFWTAAI